MQRVELTLVKYMDILGIFISMNINIASKNVSALFLLCNFFLQFALVNLVKVVALKYCYRLSLSFVMFDVLKVLKQFEFAVLFCLIDFF